MAPTTSKPADFEDEFVNIWVGKEASAPAGNSSTPDFYKTWTEKGGSHFPLFWCNTEGALNSTVSASINHPPVIGQVFGHQNEPEVCLKCSL